MIHKSFTGRCLMFLGVFISCLLGALIFQHSKASAAYDGGKLIDDSTFRNSSSMSINDIQAFLVSKNSGLASRSFELDCYGADSQERQWYSAVGAPCDQVVPASQIIYWASRIYGVNPQAVLATLQKEQSLITTTNPTDWQINQAMGYGCPTTGGCGASTFFYQIDSGVWVLRWHFERANGNSTWWRTSSGWTCGTEKNFYKPNLYPYQDVRFYDQDGVHYRTHWLASAATSALYCYTPHAYNNPRGEFGLPVYGTTGRYYTGSYNFVYWFERWFGPTTGEGFLLARSDNAEDPRQWVIYRGLKHYVPSAEIINAWNLDNTTLITLPHNYIANIPQGPALDHVASNNGGNTVYFIEDGKRYRIPSWQVMAAWNLSSIPVSYVPNDLFNLTADNGTLTGIIQDPSSGNCFMVDGPNGSGKTIFRHYRDLPMMTAWEGANPFCVPVSSDYYNRVGAVGSELLSTKISYLGGEHQVVSGYRFDAPAGVSALFPGTANEVSPATMNRLTRSATMTYMVRSKSSGNIYIIDNGQKRRITTADLLFKWAAPMSGYHSFDDAYLDVIPDGSAITGYVATNGSQRYIIDSYKVPIPSVLNSAYGNAGSLQTVSTGLLDLLPTAAGPATGFLKGKGSPHVYLLDNSGQRRWISNHEKLVLWALNDGLTIISDSIVNSFNEASAAGLFVSDGTNEFVMENGRKLGVSAAVKSEWNLSSPQIYSDGTLSRFTTAGNLSNEIKDSGLYYIVRDGMAYGTRDPGVAGVWDIDEAPAHSLDLFTYLLSGRNTLSRLVKSSTDNRTFIISDGNWFNLQEGPRRNITRSGEYIMQLDPANAPNAITEWTSFIVKTSNGDHYVIDGGNRRIFPSITVQNWWTGNGSLSVPTVSGGFVSIMPYIGPVERSVVSSTGLYYTAQTGTKRHIINSSQLGSYSPYSSVSDRLLDTMPNGTPIE